MYYMYIYVCIYICMYICMKYLCPFFLLPSVLVSNVFRHEPQRTPFFAVLRCTPFNSLGSLASHWAVKNLSSSLQNRRLPIMFFRSSLQISILLNHFVLAASSCSLASFKHCLICGFLKALPMAKQAPRPSQCASLASTSA